MVHKSTTRSLIAGRAAVALLLAASIVPLSQSGAAAVAEPHTITVVTYNVGDAGNTAAALKRDLLALIDAERPAVIGLQEVAGGGSIDGLRQVDAARDYELVLEPEGDGQRHNALLVRENIALLDHGLREISPRTEVDHRTPGTGGTGIIPPKYVNWVRVRVSGYEWVVGTVHLTPSASQYDSNRRLHNKQVANTADWFATRVAEPIVMGDFNAVPGSDLMDDLRDVARSYVDPDGTFEGRAIDHVWAADDSTGSRVAALSGYASDHKPLRAEITVVR